MGVHVCMKERGNMPVQVKANYHISLLSSLVPAEEGMYDYIVSPEELEIAEIHVDRNKNWAGQ